MLFDILTESMFVHQMFSFTTYLNKFLKCSNSLLLLLLLACCHTSLFLNVFVFLSVKYNVQVINSSPTGCLSWYMCVYNYIAQHVLNFIILQYGWLVIIDGLIDMKLYTQFISYTISSSVTLFQKCKKNCRHIITITWIFVKLYIGKLFTQKCSFILQKGLTSLVPIHLSVCPSFTKLVWTANIIKK